MTDWINILQCPVTSEELKLAEADELSTLMTEFPDAQQFLANSSATYFYPVVDGIPILLADVAVSRHSARTTTGGLGADKKKVRDFYDEQGWVSSDKGDYEDAIIYEDLREVSADYILACHKRVHRHIPPSGKYLLDAASGALQFDIYLSYSQNFTYRICVDFSLRALREAKKKLGPKGIYILCDITNLPFRDNTIDAFVSLNTIYHIPKDEQVTAIKELVRSLIRGGKGVVVYDWFKHSSWMNLSLLPFRGFVFLKNKAVKGMRRIGGGQKSFGRLYFFAHRLEYFRSQLPPFRLFVWRSVSVPFLKYYVHPGFFGKAFLDWLYQYEERHPEKCGRNGEYPMFVFEK